MQTPEGKMVGEHQGLAYYTIGQRQGLGIGGQGEPWFVAGKDMASNTLIVVQGHAHPLLLKNSSDRRRSDLDQRHGASSAVGLRRQDPLPPGRCGLRHQPGGRGQLRSRISPPRNGR